MEKPIAVIAGDIHYNMNNLALADAATRMAIAKANELNVPFIANGDTHDSKANLRGECVNALISTFKTAKIKPYVNIGNHCKIHAKSIDHSLNFLRPYAHVIDTPTYIDSLGLWMIPYQDNSEELIVLLDNIKKGSYLIMHQGVKDSNSGEYIQDSSAIDKTVLADFRAILSHYHARQDIKCGPVTDGYIGLASYIGSPYTVSFAEANDPPKGYQILMDDGSLEFEPTYLRQHRIIERQATALSDGGHVLLQTPDDLVWVKVAGSREELATVTKGKVAKVLGLIDSFRLDLIPIDANTTISDTSLNLSQGPLLDSLIDSLENTTADRKIRLKSMWKDLCE